MLKSTLLCFLAFRRDWFRSFFSNCTALGGCRVDFLNTHVYSCDVDYVMTFLKVGNGSSFFLCSGALWWVWSEDLADWSCLSFCKRGRGDPGFHGRVAASTGGSRSRGSLCLVCNSIPNTGWKTNSKKFHIPSSGLGPILVSLIREQSSATEPVSKNTTWWPLYDFGLSIHSSRISRQNKHKLKIHCWKMSWFVYDWIKSLVYSPNGCIA